MKNSIVAYTEFYFKGEAFTPVMVVDLDNYMRCCGGIPDLHPEVAKHGGIGLDSYEYDIMLGEEISYKDATGLAVEFLRDGVFDVNGFEQAWREQQMLEQLTDIARQEMDVDALGAQPKLKNALLKAYLAGKNAR